MSGGGIYIKKDRYADKIIAANVLTSGGLELTEFTEARIKTVIIDVLA